MALSKGRVAYRFSGGIDTKSDPKTVPATRLLVLENGVFTRGTSLRKRNGYSSQWMGIDGAPGTVDAAIRLARRDDELLAFTPSRCYSRQPTADQWSDTGAVYSLIGTDRPVVRTGTQQTMPDHAENGGVRLYAWEDSRGGVWYEVADAATGRIYLAATQADALGTSPRCVACGVLLHLYYAAPSLGRVYVVVVNPATPSSSVAPSILVDDLNVTNPVYDAATTTLADTPAVLAWHEASSGNVRVGFVHSSGVLGGPGTGLPFVFRDTGAIAAASPLAVAYTSGTISVVTQPSGSANVVARHYAAAGITLSTTVIIGATTSPQRIAAAWTAGISPLCWIAYEEAAPAPSNRYTVIASCTTATASATRTQRSVGLASRAWSAPGADEAFAYFVHDTTYFNTYTALRLRDSLCVARTLPGLAAGAPPRKHLSSAHVDGDTVRVALAYRERVLSENADKFTETGIRLASLNYDSEDSHQHEQLGRGLYLAGACPQHYDGRRWTEQGFHVGPELIGATPAAGGSLTSSTTYLYRAWYEWPDAQGEVHRGSVSFGTLVTLGPGDTQVTLSLPTLRLTQKPNARICVARSEAAKTGRTASLYRVTSGDPSATGPNGFVANDPTVDSVTFVDRMSDIALATQEPLYTNGGLLSNDPSALGAVVARGKSRLFFTDPSDGNVIRYSQQLDEGYGVELPPDLTVRCDPYGGDVTALATSDDSVIVWKRDAIFTFNGDGPLPNGDISQSAFSAPRLLTSDVGCADPASVVLTPVGHMFKSAKGIYLVDRSGQVSYVGAPVEAYNAQRVTAATALPDRTQIVFLTDDGTTLLYDYFFGQWSTFTNHLGFDAAVVGNAYHYLRTDGRLFRETPGVHSDDGRRITLRLETAWIHVSEALQGFQRFWNLLVLGTWLSPHQLRLQYRTDYAGQWSDPVWYDSTGESDSAGWITGGGALEIGVDPITGSVYGGGEYGAGPYGGDAPDVYQWQFYIGGRGQSVQFRFEDFERTGLAGASFELTEMLIEGGQAGTARKPSPPARSA